MNKTEEFIHKAKLKHGDKYDYSKVEYVNGHTKIIIICKYHGEFIKSPSKHLQGQCCKKCGYCKSSEKQRSNTLKFIEKSIEIHGEIYDYNKVEYTNNSTNVIIICKEHGEFLQAPSNHLVGKGCKNCGNNKIRIKKTSNSENFITKSKEIHGGDKYIYDKVLYKNNREKVIIICRIHGEFLQTPHEHLSSCGCRNCGIISRCNKQRKTNEKFIIESVKKHGHKYDYSKLDYKNCEEKVTIICNIHGDFLQRPQDHLNNGGCGKCGGVGKYNTEEFIEKSKEIHGGDKYIYDKVLYKNNREKVIIICRIHGEFLQTPSKHLQGQQCIRCSINLIYNNDDFINKSIKKHGNIYDYSKTTYINSKVDVIIICKKHGEFIQNAYSHLQGCSCPLCKNKTEGKLYEKLSLYYPSIVSQFKQRWCKNIQYLPFDFCVPEHNIILELDGEQHFRQISNWKSPDETFKIDKFKEKCANDNNYSVIRLLQEDVWNDKYDWCKELCHVIDEIKQGNDIVNVYLCKNGEYDNF